MEAQENGRRENQGEKEGQPVMQPSASQTEETGKIKTYRMKEKQKGTR